MKEITWEQLSIHKKSNYIHVDNWLKNRSDRYYMSFCGQKIAINFNFLTTQYKPKTIKICKKCSLIYRRKHGHFLESFLAELKIRDKLFINR